MLESMQQFVAEYQRLLIGMLIVAILTGVLSKATSRLWVRDFWVRFPIFGDLASLAKDRTKGSDGWMRAEEKLCAIYKQYFTLLPKDKFAERIEYLRKSSDLGKTPMPVLMYPLLFILVLAEGLGFSYLLGTWMAREGSANTHTLLMFAIVFVIAIIMSFTTHAAGHQLRRTLLLRSCFNRFKAVAGETYSTKAISLNSPQNIDDHDPDYVQIVNRVAENSDDRGSYAIVVVAIVAMVLISIISTVMRWKDLENELTRETVSSQAIHMTAKTDNGTGLSLDLPRDVLAPQQAADAKAKEETASNTKIEGASAFAMLGFIFLLTQLVGIGAGYKYSFVGRETYKKVPGVWFRYDGAYADTGGISTYDTYFHVREPLMDMANARLKDLQQRLEMNSSTRLNLVKSFNDYFVEQRNRNSAALNERTSASTSDVAHASSGQTKKKVHMESTAESTGDATDIGTSPHAASAKQALLAIDDKDMQKQFYASLPQDVRDMLRPWLQQRKEQESAKTQKKKALEEAEDLF